jgi:hypothetical protein
MIRRWMSRWLGRALSVCLLVPLEPIARADEPPLPDRVDFNRDIRPILADNCYACHGPDKNKRKAHLRLDTKEGLFSAPSDIPLIVPKDPEQSELFRRITTDDDSERMPDPKSGKRLTGHQIALIQRWIEQGAEWKGHWSYIPPQRPGVPEVDEPGFVKNPIDRFLLQPILAAHLQPAPEADRITLIRRLSFDLTGLPPSKEQVDAFLNDREPDAYERLVDRLLASPHFGERMAIYWLDLVRYADSIGYHSDNPMNVAPYREYVIRSFNANTPFDQFTIEQLAGDLLPNATLTTKVASAYNRLLQTTEEGGAQAKEYEAKYAADRVRNVSSVWLGATVGCAQCHDHKFDPFTTRDFYSLAAFFADIQEAAVGRREPGMPVPDADQSAALKKLDGQMAQAQKTLDTPTPELAAAQAEWEKQHSRPMEWITVAPSEAAMTSVRALPRQADGILRASGGHPGPIIYTVKARAGRAGLTGFRLEVLPDPALASQGPGLSENGNFVLTEFRVTAEPGGPVKLVKAIADHAQDKFPITAALDGKDDTGWAILPETGKPHTAIFEAENPLGGAETTLTFTLEHKSKYPNHAIGQFRLAVTASPNPARELELPANIRAVLAVAPEQRNEAQRNELAAYYRGIAPALQPVREALATLKAQKDQLLETIPKTLISVSGPPRTVRILPRGNWLDESGPIVEPNTPEFLPPLRAEGPRATRLDLARWLVSRDNPLPARVFVNRLWKLYFGQGLSKTLEDLGSQGEWPTHPELLDWLAVEFIDSGWDIKHMVRLIVTSGAYRRTSKPTPEQTERDPYNRLLARQGRFRIDAEMVRDNALAVSGLLSQRIGGESDKPYQPRGYWSALNFPPREWENDRGEKQYRRGLYTHWQRSFLHPSLLAFDAPSREECTAERARSNIPQQALVLLNDPTYVEAARAFAERILREGGSSNDDRLRWAFGQCLSREPKPEEMRILSSLLDKHTSEYHADPEAARKLVSIGQRPVPNALDLAELAAWTSVARVLLNLHETITRS